jgi:hypothetical protein
MLADWPACSIHTRGANSNSANHQYSIAQTTLIPTLNDGSLHRCKVIYYQSYLYVYLDDLDNVALRAKIDLVATIGSASAFIGFTAATGGLNQTHEIMSWSLSGMVIQLPTSKHHTYVQLLCMPIELSTGTSCNSM